MSFDLSDFRDFFNRIICVLRDLDGNYWRDKLPKNSDSERVLAALSNNQASVAPPPTIPAQSETLSHDVPVVDTAAIPPPSATEETPVTAVSIGQQFEDTKSKGNTFVKQVSFYLCSSIQLYIMYIG